jgi:hypothetical protein
MVAAVERRGGRRLAVREQALGALGSDVASSASPIAPPTRTEYWPAVSGRPCELHLDHRGEQPPFTLMFAGTSP